MVFKISGDVIPLLRTVVAGYTSSKMQILTQLMRAGSYLPSGSLNGEFSLGSSPSQFLISVLLVSVWWGPPDHASHEQSSVPPPDSIVLAPLCSLQVVMARVLARLPSEAERSKGAGTVLLTY